jgi:hypothetical protein
MTLIFGGLGPMTGRDNAQSGGYFGEAVEALRSAGDPRIIWGDTDDFHRGSIFEPHQRVGDAAQRRLWRLRTSVLFAALAAEAYANEVLAEILVPSDAAALDRLPTVEKLMLGPKVAGLESPLDRGREPMQTVRRLFSTRDALVHPRRGSPAATWRFLTDVDEQVIGPRAAGRYIIAVANLMEIIDPLRPPPVFYHPGGLIAKHHSVLNAHLSDIGATLEVIPSEGGPSPVSLTVLASRREAKQARERRGPRDEERA